ncbi:hypothetical protein ACFYV7_35515 [Nocardia suismassiliense]|uniref:Peptidase inhibitor family I36 n=1 Tax=Nocardia suismassiliense TaxID=2077092 RepID=A0ABW6R3Q7_9NOCA
MASTIGMLIVSGGNPSHAAADPGICPDKLVCWYGSPYYTSNGTFPHNQGAIQPVTPGSCVKTSDYIRAIVNNSEVMQVIWIRDDCKGAPISVPPHTSLSTGTDSRMLGTSIGG